jgi:hypothetical protein
MVGDKHEVREGSPGCWGDARGCEGAKELREAPAGAAVILCNIDGAEDCMATCDCR